MNDWPYSTGKYDADLWREILSRYSAGETIAGIASEPIEFGEGRVEKVTERSIFRWVSQNPALREELDAAEELHLQAQLGKVLDIADDGTNDYMEKRNKDGELVGYTLNGEHVARSRLRCEVRLNMVRARQEKLRSRGGADQVPGITINFGADVPDLPFKGKDASIDGEAPS